jgi:sugar phosphate isomerase/epimerase
LNLGEIHHLFGEHQELSMPLLPAAARERPGIRWVARGPHQSWRETVVNPPAYPYPLAVQIVLPADYARNDDFRADLDLLQKLGFAGVELNMVRPETVDLAEVRHFLGEYGLAFTQFASGLSAKTKGLSLSSPDQETWQRSVAFCRQMIDRLADSGTGIIVGFLKGGPDTNRRSAEARITEALAQIVPHAEDRRVRVLIEATNRYESAAANDLAATVRLIEAFEGPYFGFLPDTFHMNIEEPESIAASLKRWAGRYNALHLSDNNRRFPGFGAIDFTAVFNVLEETGYAGTVAIEGICPYQFREEIRAAAGHLAQAACQI